MRKIDILCPLFLLIIALLITTILILINPVILPFAIAFALLLIVFILASFCSGRYTREDSSDRTYILKR
jgi:predicted PurR-regulated permease PerM